MEPNPYKIKPIIPEHKYAFTEITDYLKTFTKDVDKYLSLINKMFFTYQVVPDARREPDMLEDEEYLYEYDCNDELVQRGDAWIYVRFKASPTAIESGRNASEPVIVCFRCCRQYDSYCTPELSMCEELSIQFTRIHLRNNGDHHIEELLDSVGMFTLTPPLPQQAEE